MIKEIHLKKDLNLVLTSRPFPAELDQEIPKQTRQKVDSPTEKVEIKRGVNQLESEH